MRATIVRLSLAAVLGIFSFAGVPAGPIVPADMTAEKAADKQFWLNTDSNVRHNRKCKHFGSTKIGRYCGANEGKACRLCGG